MPDIPARIRLRRGTAAQWASANPILAAGEPGVETDTGLLRVGNGVDTFDDLPAYLTTATNPALLTFDPSAFMSISDAALYTGNLNAAAEGAVRLGAGATNAPAGMASNSYALTLRADSNNAVQFVMSLGNGLIWRRDQNASAWSAWVATVMTDGAQSIAGNKTFTGELIATLARLTQIAEPSAGQTVNLTTGFHAANDADGSFSSGTYTPTPAGGNIKSITNGGAFTIAAPTAAGQYSMMIEVTNGAGAGAITMTGFARVAGDVFTTTNGHRFQIFIAKTLNGVTATVLAMQ